MTFPPSNPNGLYVANQAMQMGKNAGEQEAKLFNRIAIASMIAVTATTLLQVALPAVKELVAALYPKSYRDEHKHKKLTGRELER